MAAGSAGSGKSFLTIGIMHILCCNVSGLRFAIFRKSEKNLKQTTIPSYNRLKRESKSEADSIIVDMVARYPKTGSEILFIWADSAKDPELNNIRGLELTGCLFEEANQIDERYFHIAKTRVGRWNNYKCKAFIMMNLNPSIGWCKDLFYDKWADGTLPPNYYFEEFEVADNDSLSADYVEGLEDLPHEEYKRFVQNKWDYSDIPNQLIKYEWYKQCLLEDYTIGKTDRGILAIDPAWEGADETVFGRMHGSHMGWWEFYEEQDTTTTGLLGIERANEYGIVEEDVTIDVIGVGVGVIDTMRHNKFYPDPFVAGVAAEDTEGLLAIYNKRSEAHWLLREALKNEEITVEHNPLLQKQVLAAKYTVDDKKIRILSKKDIKKEIKMSPGHLDIAMMLIHKFKTSDGGTSSDIIQRQASASGVSLGAMTRAQADRIKMIKSRRMLD